MNANEGNKCKEIYIKSEKIKLSKKIYYLIKYGSLIKII